MPPAAPRQRLHHLDALRAAAMLLGIVYHASLSLALGLPWLVHDVSQTKGLFVFQAWVHGFRMELFMLVSGFFTAMLWRQEGLGVLLRHRARRILLPCLLGLVTVVPAIGLANHYASLQPARPATAVLTEPASANLWAAIRLDDLPWLEEHLAANPGILTLQHPAFGVTPLQWAGLLGRTRVLACLLDRGSPVDLRGRDGHTALHGAAFMGHAEAVRLLLARGADVNARSQSGETPLHNAGLDRGAVQYIAGLLTLPVDPAAWAEGRRSVRAQLAAAGAQALPPADGPASSAGRAAWNFLVHQPVFFLVWFLWFLVWLVALFAGCAWVAQRLGWRARPHGLLLSPANLLWLVPLTLVPTALMEAGPGLGPDPSLGIVPKPHVFLHFAWFFFFGAVYHDCDDRDGRLGAGWRVLLPVTLLGIFPLALEFATGTFGLRDSLLPRAWHRPASVLLQSAFAWMMCFASIGLFRSVLTRENPRIRYLSDSSYWLYLAHLPLVIAAQALIAGWPVPAYLKLGLMTLVIGALLLLSYEHLVRYTWLGGLLNGPRWRPGEAPPARPAAATPPAA